MVLVGDAAVRRIKRRRVEYAPRSGPGRSRHQPGRLLIVFIAIDGLVYAGAAGRDPSTRFQAAWRDRSDVHRRKLPHAVRNPGCGNAGHDRHLYAGSASAAVGPATSHAASRSPGTGRHRGDRDRFRSEPGVRGTPAHHSPQENAQTPAEEARGADQAASRHGSGTPCLLLGADLEQPVPAAPAGITLITSAGFTVARPARRT
jgi:hypothetical protein